MDRNKQTNTSSHHLPMPGFASGFKALFSLFMPRTTDSDFLRQSTDDYLRETWQQVGRDLRSAMNEYDKISSAWK